MVSFKFEPTTFVVKGAEQDSGEWAADDAEFIGKLRSLHPELAEWGDLAVGGAWGSYSQDILAVGWVYWITGRDLAFLAYIYVRQLRPNFNFGGTGLFDTDVFELGTQKPWLLPGDHVPAWAGTQALLPSSFPRG